MKKNYEIRLLVVGLILMAVMAALDTSYKEAVEDRNDHLPIQPKLLIFKIDTLPVPPPAIEEIREPFVPNPEDHEYDPNDPDADSIALEFPEDAENYYD